jgi:AMP deaminase
VKYAKNPFPSYFQMGLNATLSTDDPLMIHLTREPLIEEYSVATQVWNLSQVDLSEIAKNSVIQSGFDVNKKKSWLGEKFLDGTPDCFDMTKSNVSRIRYTFRYETFHEEMEYITAHCTQPEQTNLP